MALKNSPILKSGPWWRGKGPAGEAKKEEPIFLLEKSRGAVGGGPAKKKKQKRGRPPEKKKVAPTRKKKRSIKPGEWDSERGCAKKKRSLRTLWGKKGRRGGGLENQR